ncbi:replication-associated recombination protein A [Cesiribacter andamanensis]|uniref:Replication-associated recombination protein A n=1 Tax=Cesiribacter andamanensis AMV16 TaxID=1279009 RepID=M7N9Y2_9BACT|nr:replication-associated recombination protein A [Cesiribacter andamanensis]EMR04077.1 Replication-associated recombination protein A [Cesiribacter andamanensis AMV16]
MNLFDQSPGQQPLAERMRPTRLDEVVGQQHLLGPDAPLRKLIEAGQIPSMIFWGPPGVGKTTLASLIAHYAEAAFFTLSAISSGVKEVREVIEKARNRTRTILFIDEVHRFNKSQQDALLAAVEKGIITLVGATTENPSFEVNQALLSRCQVYVLKSLELESLKDLVRRALMQDKKLAARKLEVKEWDALLRLSGGDARRLLNLLELTADSLPLSKTVITDADVIAVSQQRLSRYDKGGEQHYDIISAFIKSIRGSDPNAAVYYLARMIEGGEDVKFIARRLLILASEDIGNANPTALVIATNTFQAVTFIGYPEAEIILSQCVVYLACSAKSNASYKAIKEARQLVKKTGDLSIPLYLRNAPTTLMKDQGYGKGYQYAHDYEQNFVDQEYLPQELSGTKLYEPGHNAREQEMRQKLRSQWKDKYGY